MPTPDLASRSSGRVTRTAREPERRCLVTRQVQPCRTMLRFVVDPDGRVCPDVDGRLPGRGMWLSADRDVVNKAVARNLFAKAARAPVKVDAGLAERVEHLLVGRALGLLGLARRAGQVVIGFEQVRAWLRSGRAGVLVSASDGATDGRRKLRQLAPELPLVTAFSRAELGTALGRESVVHVAVAGGRLAERLLVEVGRLQGFRPGTLTGPEFRGSECQIESREATATR